MVGALLLKVGGERTHSCQFWRLAPAYRLRGVCDPNSIDFVPIGGVGQGWQLLMRAGDSERRFGKGREGEDEPSELRSMS